MSQTLQYVLRRRQRTARQYREDLGNGVTLEMVWIPGGTFLMGSPEGEGDDDEVFQHEVTVPDFFMGKYPVTQAQWRAVSKLPKVERNLDPDPSGFKGNDRPVEQVSWFEAVEFCQRLAVKTQRPYRLPSEAEWEYACRAGTTTPYHFGETITSEVANCNWSASDRKTTVVGHYGFANAFGLYDMHGNVREWCYDQAHQNYEGAPIDGSAWIDDDNNVQQLRILRGGSRTSDPRYCRSASRSNYAPNYWITDIGFRVCCSVAQTP